jgi:hypothetical protein
MLNQAEQQFNAEEMAAKQKEIQSYYESQIPFLQVQKDYETLITELQELEARRAMAVMRVAQIMAPQAANTDQPNSEPTDGSKSRTLRKEQ